MSKLPYVPDEHLKAIAHVAIRSAQLDHSIETTLAHLFGPDRTTAEMILKEWNQNKQIKLMRAILLDRYPWHSENIKKFFDTLSRARSERNEVIHYLWGRVDDAGVAKLASFRPFREDKTKSMTAAEVYAVADTLLDCVQKLHRLTDWLWQDRHPPPNALVHMLQRGHAPWPLAEDQQEHPQEPALPQLPPQTNGS